MDENLKARQIADSEAGRKATALLEGLEEILQSVEADCLAAWRQAATTENREALWHRVAALENVRQTLRRRIENGRVADFNLNR